jgi:catechol 2,3-dioxygenase-like lactoylglutathione lyase family enzyme
MQVSRLDHVNIAGPAGLIEACRRFYVDVIGLTEGDRPPFTSRGFWLYAGDQPVVHLSERPFDAGSQPEGPFAHYALQCTGLADAKERLDRARIPFTVSEVPLTNQVQLFVHDPAGVALELNFRRTAD